MKNLPATEFKKIADNLHKHGTPSDRLAVQMLSLLVMDLKHTEKPLHGFHPNRHQVAWKMVVDQLGQNRVDVLCVEMVRQNEQELKQIIQAGRLPE